ncbi:MAG: hypothetical protein KDB27_20685 [Planctomycetales bacterium]|nr:hypothetical protein [Planctomycetales bacterium]
MLAEPNPMQGDLQFSVTSIPVRVSVWAWVAYAILGWNSTYDPIVSDSGPYKISRLAIWVLAVAFSILLHELGHAWVYRLFGVESRIVLYHFGGLATPDGPGAYRTLTSMQHIFVSAAGPAIQLALAGIAFGIVVLFRQTLSATEPGVFPFWSFLLQDLLLINIVWPLFNLLPVYPLDGGKISRELFLMWNSSKGIQYSLMLSVITAGAVAVFFMKTNTFMGIMMLMFAVQSYQTLQQYTGGGFGGGYGGYGGYGNDDSWR